ncbi:tetratricopeptide repeat protein [Spongiivirga sp. MCCC 1A20706]|uniref:tetratricopeptide repeat protein n=1 Tax=Spongiivirga sp. MCCC 1A20706 TaxID=3160963 RepID=UPI0039777667
MSEASNNTFFSKIWQRKVPQYLGTYFAIGFGLLQFFEFVIKRYNLSNQLLDKYLLVWLALVPAITIIIYFGGELKFKSTSLKWPKILVILNIVVVICLGLFVNGNKKNQDIAIQLTDENGNKIEAKVPILNRIKTIANFQFKNETGDAENDWYGLAFSNLLQLNLDQRPEFYAYSAYTLNTYHDALAIPSLVTPAIGMQREIARKSRNDYFTNINYTIVDDQFNFKGNLYTTADGKKVKELKATNTNLYDAIDTLKDQIFEYFPELEDNNQTHLPSSGLLSSNKEALKNHTLSQIRFINDPTALQASLELEKKAIALDPSCGTCHYYAGSSLYGMGKTDEALAYLKKAIQYNKALPARMQFSAKQSLYRATNNMDAFWKLQEMRRKQFPYEFAPYNNLISYYKSNFGIDSTKSLINEAINNGNVERGLLALHSLQLENEEYDEALKTLKKCTAQFPDRDEDRLKYATVYERQGRIGEAKKLLLEEEALDPLNPTIQVRIAALDFKNVDFKAADTRIDNGMRQATTLIDTLSYVWFKSYIFESTGQIKATFNLIKDYEGYALKRTPRNRLIATTFLRKANLALATGSYNTLEKLFEELNAYNANSESYYRCVVNSFAIIRDLKTTISPDDLMITCEGEYKNYGAGAKDYLDLLKAYQNKDFNTCVSLLESDDGKLQKLISDDYFESNIYAKAGDIQKAIDIMTLAVERKTDQPLYYYQLANLLAPTKPKKAAEYLAVALKFWEQADLDYIPYQQAKALSEKMNNYQENQKI